jgi:hypothetical protein
MNLPLICCAPKDFIIDMNEKEQELQLKIAKLEAENAELKRAEYKLASMTALAWIGMVSSTWRHSIQGYAINIRDTVFLLRKRLEDEIDVDELNRRLDIIENQALQMIEIPITPPSSSNEGIVTFSINDLLLER